MDSIISVSQLSKTYAGGFQALKTVDLEIEKGEIFALLGPNGAGKTTLIGIICGILNPSEGAVTVGGHDIIADFIETRSMIGLVPQELTTDTFETVWTTVTFSRGLFGRKADPKHIEDLLKKLSLWEKKDSRIMALSGGMKRRVMIAKALSHEPKILFLDEPTAGVDVDLRKDMWEVVKLLRQPLDSIPAALASHDLELTAEGTQLIYTYDTQAERTGITSLLNDLNEAGIKFRDLSTSQSSLEDIFVNLVKRPS